MAPPTIHRRRNALLRHRGPDDPEFRAADREMRLVGLERHIREVLAAAGPPTPELIDRLRALLPPVPGGKDSDAAA